MQSAAVYIAGVLVFVIFNMAVKMASAVVSTLDNFV
jgi:hypothetical protein